MDRSIPDSYNMLERLLGAAPSLHGWWVTKVAIGDVFVESPYLAFGELAGRLVELKASGTTNEFSAVFDSVEAELRIASPSARNLLVVGFLETLQNITLNKGLLLSSWHEWLHPRTMAAWESVVALWSGTISADEFNRRVDGEATES